MVSVSVGEMDCVSVSVGDNEKVDSVGDTVESPMLDSDGSGQMAWDLLNFAIGAS